MNIDTNELVNEDALKELTEEDKLEFKQLPPELLDVARRALAGRNKMFISKNSGGKLSTWAAKQRKDKLARRKKNKVAKLSRKKNRK